MEGKQNKTVNELLNQTGSLFSGTLHSHSPSVVGICCVFKQITFQEEGDEEHYSGT